MLSILNAQKNHSLRFQSTSSYVKCIMLANNLLVMPIQSGQMGYPAPSTSNSPLILQDQVVFCKNDKHEV